MLSVETDLNTQLNQEKKYWSDLNGAPMVTELQAKFSIPPLSSIPFGENLVLQSASRLLLNSFEWIKTSNSAFKLLEYLFNFNYFNLI